MKSLKQRLSGLHSDHRRIAQGAMRVAFFLLLGKAAGAFKEMAVAYRYGVSDVVDAYQFTMVMANWLPVTLVGALSIVLIPVLVRSRKQPRAKRARFLGELQGWTIAIGTLLAVVTYVAWPWVLEWTGQGLPAEARRMSAELMLAFAPAALLTLMTGISAARLRAHERHINTLLDSVPAVVILVWVLLATTVTGVGPLLWGTLVGYFVQSAWLLWLAARADRMWARPVLGFRSDHWPDLVKAAGVMLIGQVAMSFVGPIDQYTAANLGGNANATLGYASRLLSLLLGVGAASVGRAALPVLADIQSRGDPHRARSTALKWSVLMVLGGAAVTLAGWVLAPWGVSLVFERGAFTAANTAAVADVVRWGLLQLPFYFGVLILVQLLASQNRYRLMAAIAVANFVLKAAMNQVLAPIMGPAGIMLATSMMYALSYGCYAVAAMRSLPARVARD
ncbi:MAG TPA: lipid II flippase MurJ [Candidimonas sp.]|nr:lipid II flippase MurJ [Candidimonas sp.]